MTEEELKRQTADRLKRVRQETGYSQVAMARRMKISRQTYLDLESGKTDAKVAMLNRFANVTGCNRIWLFGLEKDSFPKGIK